MVLKRSLGIEDSSICPTQFVFYWLFLWKLDGFLGKIFESCLLARFANKQPSEVRDYRIKKSYKFE